MVDFEILSFLPFVFCKLLPSQFYHLLNIMLCDVLRQSTKDNRVIAGRINDIIALLLNFSKVVPEKLEKQNVDDHKSKQNIVLD